MLNEILLKFGKSAILVGAATLIACNTGGSPKINIDANAVGDRAKLNQFVDGDCIVPMGKGVRCGYLHVPENRSNPDSRIIKIAAAILPSKSKTPAPDPVVILSAGQVLLWLRCMKISRKCWGKL